MFRAEWLSALVTCLIIGTTLGQSQQENSSPAVLFAQLQSPETTADATREILKRASDPEVRKYLTTHLPGLIEKGPVKVQTWNNATQVAGELQITEAVPALAKWIGVQTGGGLLTLSREARLENEPAAKALALIGDPSVPALRDALQHGTAPERWNGAYALNLIGTPSAKKALQEGLRSQPDANLRDFMERALQKSK